VGPCLAADCRRLLPGACCPGCTCCHPPPASPAPCVWAPALSAPAPIPLILLRRQPLHCAPLSSLRAARCRPNHPPHPHTHTPPPCTHTHFLDCLPLSAHEDPGRRPAPGLWLPPHLLCLLGPPRRALLGLRRAVRAGGCAAGALCMRGCDGVCVHVWLCVCLSTCVLHQCVRGGGGQQRQYSRYAHLPALSDASSSRRHAHPPPHHTLPSSCPQSAAADRRAALRRRLLLCGVQGAGEGGGAAGAGGGRPPRRGTRLRAAAGSV
jgi:hypothetical protein